MTKKFDGFPDPSENWSKMPHALIGALPAFETLAELKVVLYILRHTWGWKQDEQGISLDEFEHGRRIGGERYDDGVGMARDNIINGLRRAEEHGFIVSSAAIKNGRPHKTYRLTYNDALVVKHDQSQNTTGPVVKHYQSSSKTLLVTGPEAAPADSAQTPKETSKRKESKERDLAHAFAAQSPSFKALTLHRKYAEQIASGAKHFEIRNFRTDYRGPIVITLSGEKIAYCVATLTRLYPTQEVADLTDEERAYGKWAWRLEDAYRCQPVTCVGQQGLWAWTAELPPRATADDLATADQARAPKPWSALTKAMHEATPDDVRPVRCHYAKHDKDAQALFNAGYTPEQIAHYTTWAYAEDDFIKAGAAGGGAIPMWMGRINVRIKADARAVASWCQSQKQSHESDWLARPEHVPQPEDAWTRR